MLQQGIQTIANDVNNIIHWLGLHWSFLNALIFIGAVGLAIQAFIGLAFFLSCIREKESRATIFALLQFLGMTLVLRFLLRAILSR
ncbi:MAG: hypothetical protein JRJ85_09785 [Deltaproteobacteria bacterium]|nr:hypothetical protein [Deltaproteobacteria bacterium]